MMSPDYKNVIFISFLFHPNVSTKSAGLPDFCSVNLDGKGLVKLEGNDPKDQRAKGFTSHVQLDQIC